MSLQVEKLENNMAKLTIEVPAEELEKAIESAFRKNKNRISIPGFRKGKAPRKMIEQMYGKEIFYEDAANELIPDAYEKAVEECEEEIVSNPRINVTQLEAGKPFIFTAEVALKPEVTLGKYKGVKVDKIDVSVSDEEVNAEIDRERDNSEGGKGEDYPLTIGSGAFVPGFEEALIGAEIGRETDVNVTFPEDYQAAELAGKPAVFKCTVKKIQEKQLPALDEDFVEEVSEESDTVEEYKEEIRKKLSERKEADAKSAREDAVIDAIIADAEMDIPDAMVETQQRQMVQEFAQRMQAQGISMDQYMQFTGADTNTLLEQAKPQALKRIQSRLVLEAVVAAENIVASEEEFEEEVRTMGEAYQMEADKVKELLGENGREQVMEDICIKKAVEFVVENAKESKAAAKKSGRKAKDEGEAAEEA